MSATPAIQHYLDTFTQNTCLRDGAPWAHELRQQALARFAATGFPDRRNEAWKYTSLHALEKQTFVLPGGEKPTIEHSIGINNFDADTLTFINGKLSGGIPTLTHGLPHGVTLTKLGELLEKRPIDEQTRLAQHYLKADKATAFTALNSAFTNDGLVLQLADDVVLEKPLYLIFYATNNTQPVMANPRIMLQLGKNAEATVVEHYIGAENADNFTNAVTQIDLADNAKLQHYRLQEESLAQYHIAQIHATLARDSQLQSHNLMLGGKLARTDIHAELKAPGAQCTLNGLTLAGGSQHHANHLQVDHHTGKTTSQQNYRAVVANRARGVWNGKVVVHTGADGSDAVQSSKNLLLDKIAEVDTKPELEIYADEVKCAHGATVGQLDMDALFYLRSRGIDENTARSLLVFAFADDVLTKINLTPIRKYVEKHLIQRLPDSQRIQEFAQ